jgi:hypothetical protein
MVEEDLESAIRSIYYYDHAYFKDSKIQSKVLPQLNFTG